MPLRGVFFQFLSLEKNIGKSVRKKYAFFGNTEV